MNKKNAHLVRYAQKNVFKHFRNKSFHAQRSYTLFLFERLLIIPFLVNRFTRQRNRLVKIFLDKNSPQVQCPVEHKLVGRIIYIS